MLFSQFCQLRRLVFDQSSPVQPISDFRGGYPECDRGRRRMKSGRKSLCLILDMFVKCVFIKYFFLSMATFKLAIFNQKLFWFSIFFLFSILNWFINATLCFSVTCFNTAIDVSNSKSQTLHICFVCLVFICFFIVTSFLHV